MAWTEADADALKAAIALGAFRVRYSDGSEVEYRSLGDMRSTLSLIQAEIKAQAGVRPVRAFRAGNMGGGY